MIELNPSTASFSIFSTGLVLGLLIGGISLYLWKRQIKSSGIIEISGEVHDVIPTGRDLWGFHIDGKPI